MSGCRSSCPQGQGAPTMPSSSCRTGEGAIKRSRAAQVAQKLKLEAYFLQMQQGLSCRCLQKTGLAFFTSCVRYKKHAWAAFVLPASSGEGMYCALPPVLACPSSTHDQSTVTGHTTACQQQSSCIAMSQWLCIVAVQLHSKCAWQTPGLCSNKAC